VSLHDLAAEVARLDRAAKTAEANLKQAKEKMIAAMDEADVDKVVTTSGKATVTLVNGERLSVDYDALENLAPESVSEIRVRKVDLDLFRAAVMSGTIDGSVAEAVSRTATYRQVRVTRK